MSDKWTKQDDNILTFQISLRKEMRESGDWTFEQYKERLEAWFRKDAQRKILKARRVERERVRQLGGGKKIAKLLLKPAGRKRA